LCLLLTPVALTAVTRVTCADAVCTCVPERSATPRSKNALAQIIFGQKSRLRCVSISITATGAAS
jgi:hypothetical protein